MRRDSHRPAGPGPEDEPGGLRPLQIVCIVGVFASALAGVLAFDEVSIKAVVASLCFAIILVADNLWRGLRTGKLALRGGLIDGATEPVAYFGAALLYLGMIGAMIYLGVDLLMSEA